MDRKRSLLLLAVITMVSQMAHGAERMAGATVLLEAPTARAASLGESLSAVPDDVAGFAYNPSLLDSLGTGQASFLYQAGFLDQRFGQLLMGTPIRNGGAGLSIGYFDGGSMNFLQAGKTRSVTAQRDLSIGLSGARTLGRTSVGLTMKYLSSTLLDTYSAQAVAFDMGMHTPLQRNWMIGAAIQNIGTEMKYLDSGDPLPGVARLGLSRKFSGRSTTSLITLDGRYRLNEQDFIPAVGMEVNIGPMAVRTGYVHGANHSFSVGAGFLLGMSNIDYAFGLVDDIEGQHRISVSMRFGDGRATPQTVKKPNYYVEQAMNALAKSNVPAAVPAVEAIPAAYPGPIALAPIPEEAPAARVYELKEGETLESIAQSVYGRPEEWTKIYSANWHIFLNPADIKPGQKIILPE